MTAAGESEAKGAQPTVTASARRRALGRVNLWTAGLLLAAIIGMVNYLSYRHYDRWDWTSTHQYTLSERTKKVIAELSQPVDIYVFLSDHYRNFSDVRELLQRYRAASSRVQVHYVDPDERPAEYNALLRKFGVRAAQLQTGQVVADVAAVVVSGNKKWRINRNDLVSLDYDPAKGVSEAKVDVTTERALTGGILQVIRGRPTRVCVTSGHGEWSLDDSTDGRSLWGLKQELKRDNVELETITTRGKAKVPDECDAVFVIGPVNAFSSQEADLLGDYVRNGGRVLLALDPVFDQNEVQPTGFESMARQFGIRIDPSVVMELDPSRMLTPSPMEAFLVTDYGDHVTTRPFQGQPTVVHMVRSVRPVDKEKATALLLTSAKAYAETDPAAIDPTKDLAPGPDDIKGPLAIASAYEAKSPAHGKDGRKGRLIVVGDSDFLRSDFLNSPQFINASLIDAWTGWLTERKALISIAPRKMDAAAILMTDEDLNGVLFRVLVLMPAAVMLLGFAVWWSRRS